MTPENETTLRLLYGKAAPLTENALAAEVIRLRTKEVTAAMLYSTFGQVQHQFGEVTHQVSTEYFRER